MDRNKDQGQHSFTAVQDIETPRPITIPNALALEADVFRQKANDAGLQCMVIMATLTENPEVMSVAGLSSDSFVRIPSDLLDVIADMTRTTGRLPDSVSFVVRQGDVEEEKFFDLDNMPEPAEPDYDTVEERDKAFNERYSHGEESCKCGTPGCIGYQSTSQRMEFMANALEERGWSAYLIINAPNSPPYLYTSGLSVKSDKIPDIWPELVLFGFDLENAGFVVNRVLDWWLKEGGPVLNKEWSPYPDGGSIKIVEIEEDQGDYQLFNRTEMFREEMGLPPMFKRAQILVSDSDGVFREGGHNPFMKRKTFGIIEE